MTILQLRTFETQIMTTLELYFINSLQDSVAERIKHKACNIFTYREEISNPVRSNVTQKVTHKR